MKIGNWRMTLLSICAIVIAVISCSQNEPEPSGEQAMPVCIVPVEKREMMIPISTTGVLSPGEELKLSFKTGGIIDKISVSEGENVQKGQILATLVLDEINARVAQAQAAFEKVRRDFARAETLYADSAITLQTLQNTETALELARADMKIAEFNQKYSVIRAPAEGKILTCLMESGELVDSGYPVILFGCTRTGWVVKAGLVDREIVRVQLEDSARISFDVFPDRVFNGQVSELAGSAEPGQGTYEIEISLASPPQNLLAGLISKIQLFPSRMQSFYLVPVESVVELQGREGYVFTIYHDRAVKIPVTIGNLFSHQLGITMGLQEVNHVVTRGASFLKDGQPVRVSTASNHMKTGE